MRPPLLLLISVNCVGLTPMFLMALKKKQE